MNANKFLKISGAALFFLASTAQSAPSPDDALMYVDRVENEIKAGAQLLKKRPSTSEIGAHSLKMKELMNYGRGFGVKDVWERGYDSCAGVGAIAWNFWLFNMVPKYRGDKIDEKEHKATEMRYRNALKECRSDAKLAKNTK